MKKEKQDYRLYASHPTQENVTAAEGHRFQRVTPRYVLVYTAGTVPETWVEVAGTDLKRLTREDEGWLVDCGTALAAEAIRRRSQESGKALSDLVDTLEKELARELAHSQSGETEGEAWED